MDKGRKYPLELADVSYVDDCMFPVMSAHDVIVRKNQRAVSSINFTFAKYRLLLNFKAGKTECMLMWCSVLCK